MKCCLRGEGCPLAPRLAQKKSRCSGKHVAGINSLGPVSLSSLGMLGTLLKSTFPDTGQGIFTGHVYCYSRSLPSWVGPACPIGLRCVLYGSWMQPFEMAPIHPKVHLRKPSCPFEFQSLNPGEAPSGSRRGEHVDSSARLGMSSFLCPASILWQRHWVSGSNPNSLSFQSSPPFTLGVAQNRSFPLWDSSTQ